MEGSNICLKGADQPLASSTVLIDAIDLQFPMRANQTVCFFAWVPFTLAGVLSGYKFTINGPSSPSNAMWSGQVLNVSGVLILTPVVATAFGTTVAGALATAATHIATFAGTIENGANAGNLSVQFAQNVSDSGAITIKRGACLVINPVT